MKNTATVRNDEEVARADGEGKSIFQLPVNSIALADAYGIFKRTLEKTGDRWMNRSPSLCYGGRVTTSLSLIRTMRRPAYRGRCEGKVMN